MALTSKVYRIDNSLQPINKQAAKGCHSIGSKYDEKPFHALAGKGCLEWALKNCRVTPNETDLIYKIAEGCKVPVLEVLPMVQEWIEKGRAEWREEGLVLMRTKRPRLSAEAKKDIAIWFFVRFKIVELCKALRGKITKEPEFYIADISNRLYDVAIQEEGRMMLFTDYVKRISGVEDDLSGSLAQVSCAVLMLRQEFSALTEIDKATGKSTSESKGYTTIAYSVTNPNKEQAAYIRSMIRPMDKE